MAEPELRRLSIRALVACAVRCATRVQPLLSETATAANVGDDSGLTRVNNICLLLCQTFCQEGLNAGSALARMVEQAKWKEEKEPTVSKDPTQACMDATFAAVTGVAFQRPAFPGVATSSDAEAVRNNVTAAIRHALEATDTALGTRARSMLQEAVDRDLKLLASLNLGIYPEIGKVLEPMENGPLGALWPMGQPEGLRSSVSTPALDQQPLLPSTPEPPLARNEIKLTAPEAVRTPCPPTLCRYLRPDRLVQALREHRFYCAKLSSFNDPFDGQILSHYPFGKEALLAAVRVELNRLLNTTARL